MFSQATSSNLSEAILAANRIEKNFLKTQSLTNERDRKKIRLNMDRHMDAFLQMTRKRHETWHRHDKYFREALKKEKDRHEKRKQRYRSATNPVHITFPSLITLNLRPEPLTKVEQRTYQVLQASQKFLDESSTRSKSNLSKSRPSTTQNIRKGSPTTTTARSSITFNSSSLIIPMTQSIDFDEYNRLMNESLKRETYSDFVDHFIKFRPEFREQFARSHQVNKRQDALEKLKEFNQIHTKTKDQRFHNLISSLIDFRTQEK
jgi:hypothetical protein